MNNINKFNKNIYQVWYQGYENIENKSYKENIKNWKILNPDWNYNLLSDTELQIACATYSKECITAYNKAEAMHTKIDLGKLVMVYLYGGIMVDMDMYALRSLEISRQIKEIIKNYEDNGEDIIGLSLSNVNIIESYLLNNTSIMHNNAMVISSPKNKFLKLLIDYIINNIDTYSGKGLDKSIYVQYTTGPRIFNQFVNNNKNSSKIISFDYKLFEPCIFGNECDIDTNTIAIHIYEGSWYSPTTKKIASMYKSKNFNILLLLGFFISYIVYVNKFNNISIAILVSYIILISYFILI
jgi:mannosyltransferase OCH1-like enzyme